MVERACFTSLDDGATADCLFGSVTPRMMAVGAHAHRRPTGRAEVGAVPLHARGNSYEIGTSSLYSRVTSSVHACCISGVPRYCAFAPDGGQAIVESKVPATMAAVLANLAGTSLCIAPSRPPLNA